MDRDPASPRVLFVIDWFHRTGGTEMHLAQLLRWLFAHGVYCEVVIFDMGDNELLDDLRARGIRVHHLPVGREISPSAWRSAWRLRRIIREGGFDVAQTFHQKADSYGALVARMSGIRHLVSSKRDTGVNRGAHHFFLNRRLRHLFERTIVVSEAVADAIVATNGVSRDSIAKIYNGVDTKKFMPASAERRAASRARFGFTGEDLVIGMVAGFRPEKEHRTLLTAVDELRARVPQLKLLLIGDGPLLPSLREEFGHKGFVEFAGDCNDVWNALAAMDIGCLSSSHEGFSNAIVEMMAAGLPMIVTNVGGNAEAVIDGDNGFVIAPRDGAAIVRGLTDLHAASERRATMGRRSRELVLEKFSEDQMCERHAKLYRELCGAGFPVRATPQSG